MLTYDQALSGVSDRAVSEAAQRFRRGDVAGQSKTYPPSVPEFVAEARKHQEYLDIKARPRLPAPEYRRGPLAPFQIAKQKALAENANRPVIVEDASLETFKAMSTAKQLPEGSKWVASLGVIYGPDPKQVRAST